MTTQVIQDNHMETAVQDGAPPKVSWPYGDGTSPIKHIIYVIKENQTYDQVFGDMSEGDGDLALTKYPAAVTPNLHALSLQFGLYDNFYSDGQTSADGHNWVMSANTSDFNMKMWPETYGNRRQTGHYQGHSATDLSAGGYLWDAASRAGVTYRNYGEFLADPNLAYTIIPEAQAGTCQGPIASTYVYKLIPRGYVICLPPAVPISNAPGLVGHTDLQYPGENYQYSDIDRMFAWEHEFRNYIVNNDLPQLEIVWLPNDHTKGTAPLYPTSSSFLALNDQALGMMVDEVSHSKYWGSTAIFITQDDAQGAWDHVNAQRTEALIVSPYTRTSRPVVYSNLYDDNSMLRTMESLLGLNPMSQFDMTATPMWSGFNASPNLQPYDMKPVQIPITYNPVPPPTPTPTVTTTPTMTTTPVVTTPTVTTTPVVTRTVTTTPVVTPTATVTPTPAVTMTRVVMPTATETPTPAVTKTATATKRLSGAPAIRLLSSRPVGSIGVRVQIQSIYSHRGRPYLICKALCRLTGHSIPSFWNALTIIDYWRASW